MIVMAYENGDLETLRQFLSPEVYEPFAAAIEARKAKGYTVEASFAGIREVKLARRPLRPGDQRGATSPCASSASSPRWCATPRAASSRARRTS